MAAVPVQRILARIGGLQGVQGCVALVTCHRAELYVESDGRLDVEAGVREFFQSASFKAAVGGATALRPEDALRVLRGEASVRHLFRVIAGLDSKILGESEIVGQVRAALARAHEAGTLSRELAKTFEAALRVGRAVRTEPGFQGRRASYAREAVRLLVERLGDRTDRRVAVVGAGQLAHGICRELRGRAHHLTILNRSVPAGRLLAQTYGGRFEPLERLAEVLPSQDAAVVAVNGGPHRWPLPSDPGRLRLVVDLSVPATIEPATSLPDVVRLDDVLERMATRGRPPPDVLQRVETIVEDAAGAFLAGAPTRNPGAEALRSLAQLAETVHRQELERARAKLPHLSPRDLAVLETLLASSRKRLLRHPARFFAQNPSTENEAAALRRVFGLAGKGST